MNILWSHGVSFVFAQYSEERKRYHDEEINVSLFFRFAKIVLKEILSPR